jgi:hypothetical protein
MSRGWKLAISLVWFPLIFAQLFAIDLVLVILGHPL